MTLNRNDIIKRFKPKSEDNPNPLVITPILDFEDQIGICGFDIRLGKQFIVFKEHINEYLPLNLQKFNEMEIRKYQEEIIVPIKQYIILHPGKLIIGCTLEYVSIPCDLECQVEGRSSWARLGLIIATATTVEPNYKGVITLELSNTGTIPLKLYPGIKIAQLIFRETKSIVEDNYRKNNKYNLSIGPGYSKIFKDKWLEYFLESKK
jgi:dCTP deaminase